MRFMINSHSETSEDNSDLTRSNISPNADKLSQYCVNREI